MEDEMDGSIAPNCPADLVPMQLAGTDEVPRWECAECGLVRL
jgi:Zn ribbon nucleic-acid-binding protein